jgi:hypothetical protein
MSRGTLRLDCLRHLWLTHRHVTAVSRGEGRSYCAISTEVLAKVSQPDLKVEIGAVWWLPPDLTFYPGGKGRFCLMVALETSAERVPVRAHYVAGSTKPSGRPKIAVEAGEAGLSERTYFSFWWINDIGIPTLVGCGKFIGCLDPARHPEINAAIRAGKRAVLKKLVSR